MLQVRRFGITMEMDEKQLCSYCMCDSKAAIVAENVVVGHLSFGAQNAGIKEYFEKNYRL